MKRYHYLTYIFIICLLFIISCTENPFFEDKIEVQENRIVRGKVNLGIGIIPSGVYIWLEGFNLSDWTYEDGNFMIELPPSETQPGNGLNGIYRLYVYTANYQYKQYDLLLLNGEFEYNTSILDADGNFKYTIVITKILNIRTIIEPTKIMSTNKDPINFTIRLESLVDSVIVRTHFNIWNTPSSLVFLKNDSPISEAILIQGSPATLLTVIIKDVVLWPTSFVFSSGFFNEGVYLVRPYLQLIQEGLPDELLLSIDKDIFNVDYHYLNWPIKQQAGLLTVENISE